MSTASLPPSLDGRAGSRHERTSSRLPSDTYDEVLLATDDESAN